MIKTYAKLNNNIVVNVEMADETWVNSQANKENYVAYTSDNPAIIGGEYTAGYFYDIQPYESWTKDGQGHWISPIPHPDDNKRYNWNESTQEWIEIN
jgi:hypothetical protein